MTKPLQLAFVNYQKGAYIVMEGKINDARFFIIRQGKVRLSKDLEVVEEEGGNLLGPGDFFGVVSTMSSHSQIETAQAVTDVTLISVMKEQYGQLIQNNTPVAMKIIFQFSKRMRYLDEALTKLTLKSNADETPSHLYRVAEYYVRQSQYNHAYYAYARYLKYCHGGEFGDVVRERMMKISPYVKSVKLEFTPDEFNRRYPKESMIFSEGELGEELFIIQRGSVKILKIVDNNEVLLAVLKAGDIFGEMALLESKPRAACAIAYEDCSLMAVSRANFERMVKDQPQIVARLTTLLAERIWFIYKQLANTLIDDPIGRMYDVLLIQLEKNRIPISNTPYAFDFGFKELANMVGIPQKDGAFIMKKFLENRAIRINKNADKERIYTIDVSDIARQTEFYRKMQKIERARRERIL
jgi:CRP-like cAMP-binding protein